MLAHGETVGMFQVESQGMRRALVDMRPDRFEDMIALVALYRPGPMANIPTYCARKLGEEQIEYLHPELEPILEATYGIITYQEQVQQIAQATWPATVSAKADLLRRAMGKKIKAEMDAQRGDFLAGAIERGIRKRTADTIFDACAKFAEYGFNKSHSAPYALLTYQTAYMKANYPVEFLAASMTLDMSNTDKLAEFRGEAQRLGIKVEAPSVNRSGAAFDVEGDTIYYALAALKGVGGQAVDAIVAARGERALHRPGGFRRPGEPARRQQARAGKPRRRGRLRRARGESRPRLRRRRFHAVRGAAHPRGADHRPDELFGGAAARPHRGCRRSSRGCRPSGCRRSSRPSASFSPAIRSTTTRPRSSACACSRGPSSRAR